MARHKTPNAVLKKRGSKKVRDEIEPEDGEVVPTMDLTHEARMAWDRIKSELAAMGVLKPAYADFMTLAADAIGDIVIANRDIATRGQISITERGETKNPSFTIKNSAQTTAYKYLMALGLTPTTISKLTGGKQEDEENPFIKLLNS